MSIARAASRVTRRSDRLRRPLDAPRRPQPDSARAADRNAVDLFLIFAGANIVATTLQVGASLPSSFSLSVAMGVIAAGAIGGAALTAVLAPIGTRLRVPSIVAARAPLGMSGAQALALLLFVTNFAWIALNNVIAASISSRLTGRGHHRRVGDDARAPRDAHRAGRARAWPRWSIGWRCP